MDTPRGALRRAMPSMFHRRLLLLLVGMALAALAVVAQLTRLTVLEGAQRLEDAERVLSTVSLLPTVRGSIVDRKGRVLAEDAPSEDIAFSYDVISGEWAYDQAASAAREEAGDQWAGMTPTRRQAAIVQAAEPFKDRLHRMWQTVGRISGVDGETLADRRQAVLRRVQLIRADVWSRRALREAKLRDEPVPFADVAIDIAEQRQAHTLLHDVPPEAVRYFRRHADEFPGLKIVSGKSRVYPTRGATVRIDRTHFPSPLRHPEPIEIKVDHVADHLIGGMRDIWAEDVDESEGGRPYRRADGTVDMGGYLPGDRRGKRGIEAAEEPRLRGTRGRVIHNLETDRVRTEQPTPGRDVRLTLDAHLQARIQALMHPDAGLMRVQPFHRNDDLPVGTPLNGAVVVMEVDTGDVLALVSSPAGPPDDDADASQTDAATKTDVGPTASDADGAGDAPSDTDWPGEIDQWAINRPIAAIYPPGSTIKPIVYTLAAAAGAIQTDQVIECQGHFYEDNPNRFRCWIYRERYWYRTHGPLAPVEAIARSCNIYFFSCGERLGPERLIEGLNRFGFDGVAGIGLPGEVSGILPRLDGPNAPGRDPTSRNAVLMGIGQGPIAATPLQVAAAHATLARGGYYLSPILMDHQRGSQRGREITLRPRVVDLALRGMYESANNADYGTGHHLSGVNPTRESPKGEPILNLPDVRTWAKTGTAQAPTRFEDANDNDRLDEGETILRQGNHSWYVCHVAPAGSDRPKYVVATVVEYGGSGGRVSGPVANQVLHALRAEGYL